ncbi:2-C-methyl-D-erythritol 4-phosphate cytidylyltransferase [Acidiphilium sp.]|uniref:2-C-methyl-D-erythritol 4-phosphate cytidylyltransferase n=1 Tax=Acidiphilium sp. TaxID=527 RepID=UPI003D038830
MIAALIVAGGRGHRLGGPVPKQYRLLDGVAIIRHSIVAFRDHPLIDQVRVVIHPDDRALFAAATAGMDVAPPVMGGASRQDSVRLGLESLAALAPDRVVIHDAVRPFVAASTIAAVIAALDHTPGAIAGVRLADTLKRCQGALITGTVERTNLWRAQTPQGFRFAAILAAHRAHAGRADLTDDAAVAELAGLAVTMVEASDDNFKITTEDDLRRAAFMMQLG